MMRLFLAINVTEAIKNKIARLLLQLQQQYPDKTIRWVKPNKLHITLRFIGDSSPEKIVEYHHALKPLSEQFSKFDIQFSEIITFPAKKPRVIAMGIQASVELLNLHEQIEKALQKCGLEPETRAFLPHLTLGRVRRKIDLKPVNILKPNLSTLEVKQLILFNSETIQHDNYSPIFNVSFTNSVNICKPK